MKNLNRKIIGGNDVLAKGNNKKFLVYDNYYRNKFVIENQNPVNEISITFYDLTNAKSLLGVTDENDVSQWNTVLEYGDYGAFLTEEYNQIVFESVSVSGNKITLVPENQLYDNIFGIEWYAYSAIDEELLESVTIKYPNPNIGYIVLDGLDVARNLVVEEFAAGLLFTVLSDNRALGTFDDTGLENVTEININGNGLTSITINNMNNVNRFRASNNALDQTSVDGIIAKCVSNNINNGQLYLDGGTNAVPSAQGATDISTLQSRGWLVFVNS